MGLSDFRIKKCSPAEKRYELPDGNGLWLRVAPSGLKTWVFRYRFEGVPRRMGLGKYPGIGLAAARKKHAIAVSELQNGIDPGAKAVEAKAKLKSAPTIEDLIQELWEYELQHKKSGPETLRLLTKDVIGPWGNRKVGAIKRRDIVLLLDKVRERGPIIGNRVHGALSRLFNFAAERGVIEDSPCTRIRKAPERVRNRVLADEEIRLFWNAMNLENTDVDIYRVTKLALKMVLLTGQRPGEVAGMRWDEIDEDTWNIPAERMKGKEPHSVPLTPMALDVLDEARIYSRGNFIFASSHKENVPITRHAITRAVKRHWPEIGNENPFTPHDLRRTVRTRLAGLGVMDIIAERVLGHKLQGIIAVYNQYDYSSEKRQALKKWENKLRRILKIDTGKHAKVIALR